MTTYGSNTQVCHNCGLVSTVSTVTSTNTMGSPDLDLRPAMMMRWTIGAWIHRCKECGYVSKDLALAPKKKYIPNDYLFVDSMDMPELAKDFYKRYLIDKNDEDYRKAFSFGLNAAWVCDDNDNFHAPKIREEILGIEELIFDDPEDDKNSLLLLITDVARRAEKFDLGLLFLERINSDEEIIQQLIEAQKKLIEARDTKCYTISEVLDPEKPE